jgi:hypothetical protein
MVGSSRSAVESVSQRSPATASSARKATISPRVAATPRLAADPKPELRLDRTNLVPTCRATTPAEPLGDALSTTSTSSAWLSRDSRQPRKRSVGRLETTTTETLRN